MDRSAISEEDEPSYAENHRPVSEFVNPMLRSLVSRQKRSRRPGSIVTDEQRKIELLARYQNPKLHSSELKQQEKKRRAEQAAQVASSTKELLVEMDYAND